MREDITPLLYWLSNVNRFPELAKLALTYLSIPANSVDAERCVSQFTQTNAPQRRGYSYENLAQQVMFAFNAKL